jgi:hypothetical protein
MVELARVEPRRRLEVGERAGDDAHVDAVEEPPEPRDEEEKPVVELLVGRGGG